MATTRLMPLHIGKGRTVGTAIAGTKAHTPKKKRVMAAPANVSGSLLIDIQAKLQEGKGAGYARWAKNFNLKQLSQTLIYLEENNLLDRSVLEERTAATTAQYHTLSAKMKSAEQRMAEIKVLQQQMVGYHHHPHFAG